MYIENDIKVVRVIRLIYLVINEISVMNLYITLTPAYYVDLCCYILLYNDLD